jgi:hypothetical protein
MQAKKENGLVQTNVTFNEEVEMKDYKLEQLEENYGSVFEEILCEVFHVENQDESLESIEGLAIYDLRSNDELEIRRERDLRILDGESATIEDLELLEKQAIDYFKNPTRVFTPSEDVIVEDVVTGFIQVNAGIKFDENGKAKEIWKSFGQKLVVNVDRLFDPESIVDQVRSLGFDMTDLVRVVFYGPSLEQIVGSHEYSKGEKKLLEALSEEYSNILLAVPESRDTSDDSIFAYVENLKKESIQTGLDLGLDRSTIGHWEQTHIRLEELRLEANEQREVDRIRKIEERFAKRRTKYIENFREARLIINSLNNKNVLIKDLVDVDIKVLNQVLYLCNKDECRINEPAIYFQLNALAKRKATLDTDIGFDQESLSFIQRINKGEHVDIHLLSFDELDGILKILWSNSGIRINKEYKSVYFTLKERFYHLKNVAQKRAA